MESRLIWILLTVLFITDVSFNEEIHQRVDRFETTDLSGDKILDDRNKEMVQHRRKRSTNNNTQTTQNDNSGTGSGKSAIAEFYSDPSNRAMYLVLPILILIYGGCSSVYCVHKCRLYLVRRRIKAQRRRLREERERINDNIIDCDNSVTPITILPNTIGKARSMIDIKNENQHPKIVRPSSSIPAFSVDQISCTNKEIDNLTIDDIEHNSDHKIQPEEKEPEMEVKDIKKTNLINQEMEVKDIKKTNLINQEVMKPEMKQQKSETENKETSFTQNKESSIVVDSEKSIDNSPESLKTSKRLSKLSFQDVAEILSYYGESKHKPDVIPEDEENDVPLKRKVKKWKHKVFNS